MTRSCLALFSLCSDLAKYFAFIPAFFGSLYGEAPLETLNILNLHSNESAILSCVIFNTFMLLAFFPLALRGIQVKPKPPTKLLAQHLLLYGVGGILLPFIAIKAIDSLLSTVGVVV